MSCLGKSPTAIAAPKIREILPGTVLALPEEQDKVQAEAQGLPIAAGLPPAQTPAGFGVTHSCQAPSSLWTWLRNSGISLAGACCL